MSEWIKVSIAAAVGGVLTLLAGSCPKAWCSRAYGVVTAKAVAVLEALLWAFHNARSGLCFPSLRDDRRGGPLRPLDRRGGHQGP